MLKISQKSVDSLNDKLVFHKSSLGSALKPLLYWYPSKKGFCFLSLCAAVSVAIHTESLFNFFFLCKRALEGFVLTIVLTSHVLCSILWMKIYKKITAFNTFKTLGLESSCFFPIPIHTVHEPKFSLVTTVDPCLETTLKHLHLHWVQLQVSFRVHSFKVPLKCEALSHIVERCFQLTGC